jgi:hypothetical protein
MRCGVIVPGGNRVVNRPGPIGARLRFRHGFLLGGAFAVGTVWAGLATDNLSEGRRDREWRCQCDLAMSFGESFLMWLAIAIMAIGYALAIVMTVRRATRRLGVGMLVGITVTLPVVVLLAALATWGEGNS